MTFKNIIKNIFNEEVTNPASFASRKGFDHKGTGDKTSDAYKKQHREHMQEVREKEREKEKLLKQMKKSDEKSQKETGNSIFHPRDYLLNSPLKYTLKETFLLHLIKYLDDNNLNEIKEAINLMSEYPTLKKFVLETSHSAFDKEKEFHVYKLEEHFFNDSNTEYELPENDFYIWTSSEQSALLKLENYDDAMLLEIKISPDKILIYIPAFTKLIEELCFSGKIEAPKNNILRLAKKYNEIILPGTINKTHINKIY